MKNIITSMNKKKYDKKIKPYNNSHFQIPLYRIPIVSLLTIFFPIWLLGVASLVIFFQDFALADRVASIATILLAFIAFMPVIREQIPPNPKLTFIEILLYL